MPAPTSVTYGLVRYQSLTFQTVLGSGTDTIPNSSFVTTSGLAALAATTPTSPLITFLNTVWGSSALCEAGFRAIGGRITVRPTAAAQATDILTTTWIAVGVVPALVIAGAQAAFGQTLEIVISAPHSIIQ